jgi:hypothetical protein
MKPTYAIAGLEPRDHLCCIYETAEEQGRRNKQHVSDIVFRVFASAWYIGRCTR